MLFYTRGDRQVIRQNKEFGKQAAAYNV